MEGEVYEAWRVNLEHSQHLGHKTQGLEENLSILTWDSIGENEDFKGSVFTAEFQA